MLYPQRCGRELPTEGTAVAYDSHVSQHSSDRAPGVHVHCNPHGPHPPGLARSLTQVSLRATFCHGREPRADTARVLWGDRVGPRLVLVPTGCRSGVTHADASAQVACPSGAEPCCRACAPWGPGSPSLASWAGAGICTARPHPHSCRPPCGPVLYGRSSVGHVLVFEREGPGGDQEPSVNTALCLWTRVKTQGWRLASVAVSWFGNLRG